MKAFRQNVLIIGDGEEKLSFEPEAGNKKGDKNNCLIIRFYKLNKEISSIYLDKDEIQDVIEELEYWKSKL